MRILNVGIIGMGRIGRFGHIPELCAHPEHFRCVAVADNVPERLENLPDCVREARRCASLDELLAVPELDMVTIGTRHPDHVPMALKIMAAGKIAVVEKPVAAGTAEMNLLREALKEHPGKLFFRHNRRFEAPFLKLREVIASGVIGEVQYIKLYRSIGYCRRNDWMTMPEFYGGLLTNWGPHLLDQALQLLESPVRNIWADVRHVISIGAGDDLFKIVLTGENGRVADVEVSGCNALPGREMEIIGSRGSIAYENGKLHARYIDPCVELKALRPHPENPPFEYGNFDEKLYFVDSLYEVPVNPPSIWDAIYDDVVNGISCPVTFDQAAEVVRVTEEAYRLSNFKPIQSFRSKAVPVRRKDE